MTGYTVHTGSNDKFRQGWDEIFKKGKQTKKTSTKKTAGKTSAKSKKK